MIFENTYYLPNFEMNRKYVSRETYLMNSQKVVIPAQAGIQGICKVLKGLDSRFHGNDGEKSFLTYYENRTLS